MTSTMATTRMKYNTAERASGSQSVGIPNSMIPMLLKLAAM